MRKEVMQRVLCVLGGTHKKCQRGKNTQAPISFSFGSPKGMWKAKAQQRLRSLGDGDRFSLSVRLDRTNVSVDL